MNGASSRPKPKAFAVARPRRSFGLDAPRPPDIERTEAEILAWLATRTPQVFWLRAAEPAPRGGVRGASTLALLLPGARIAVLRIDVRSGGLGPDMLALEEACRARRIPLSVVKDTEEVRAALRRLGIEAEEG